MLLDTSLLWRALMAAALMAGQRAHVSASPISTTDDGAAQNRVQRGKIVPGGWAMAGAAQEGANAKCTYQNTSASYQSFAGSIPVYDFAVSMINFSSDPWKPAGALIDRIASPDKGSMRVLDPQLYASGNTASNTNFLTPVDSNAAQNVESAIWDISGQKVRTECVPRN